MTAFIYTDPPELATLRALAPQLNPNGGARELGSATVAALEALASKVSDIVLANEASHASFSARMASVETVVERTVGTARVHEAKIGELYSVGQASRTRIDSALQELLASTTAKFASIDETLAGFTARYQDVTATLEAQRAFMQNIADAGVSPSPIDVARELRIETKLSELEAQVQALGAMGGSKGMASEGPNKTLFRDIGDLGKLGEKATYDEWTRVLRASICECRPQFADSLALARAKGSEAITGGALTSNDPPGLMNFSRQLFSLLLRSTSGEYHKIVAASEDLPLNGLDAWRALHYRRLPKSRALAYSLKHELIKATPCKDMPGLRAGLLRMDELMRRHDDAAAKPLDESSKCDAILALLPPAMLEKVQLESDIDADSFIELRKWVEARLNTAVAGVTYASLASSNAMDIGAVDGTLNGPKGPKEPPGIVPEDPLQGKDPWKRAAIASASTGASAAPSDIEALRNQMQELCAVVQGRGTKGGFKGGGKGGSLDAARAFNGACYNCGKTGHRAFECPERASRGAPKGAGTVGGVGEKGEKRSFPTPPRLPAHIRPKVCKFGMKCSNPRCTYIHVKTASGRSVGSLGLGDTPIDEIKELLSYEGGNLYSLDDSSMNAITQDNGSENDEGDVDPLGLIANLEPVPHALPPVPPPPVPPVLVAVARFARRHRRHRYSSDTSSGEEQDKRDRARQLALEGGPIFGQPGKCEAVQRPVSTSPIAQPIFAPFQGQAQRK